MNSVPLYDFTINFCCPALPTDVSNLCRAPLYKVREHVLGGFYRFSGPCRQQQQQVHGFVAPASKTDLTQCEIVMNTATTKATTISVKPSKFREQNPPLEQLACCIGGGLVGMARAVRSPQFNDCSLHIQTFTLNRDSIHPRPSFSFSCWRVCKFVLNAAHEWVIHKR